MARLEVVIHTDPEALKDHLSDFGSRASGKGLEAVVQERKGSGECVVAYKIQGDEVRGRAHAMAMYTSGEQGICVEFNVVHVVTSPPTPRPPPPRQLTRCNKSKTGS